MAFRTLLLISSLALILSSCGNKDVTDKQKQNYTIDYYASSNNLKELVSKESAKGKKTVLFFTAGWCRPCTEFKRTLKSKEVTEAFKDATLVIIDTDKDKKKDKISYLYNIGAIPTFIKVDGNAEPVNTMVGGDWVSPTPQQIAISMKKFIR